MKRTPYEPPRQGALGQLFDSIFVMVLVAATLLASLYLTIASADSAGEPGPEVAVAAKALERTGDAKALETERFKALGWEEKQISARRQVIAAKSYEFDWPLLAVTALVIVGYFAFTVRASDKELREVIEERFGPAPGGPKS